jgi:hypothetical protein
MAILNSLNFTHLVVFSRRNLELKNNSKEKTRNEIINLKSKKVDTDSGAVRIEIFTIPL